MSDNRRDFEISHEGMSNKEFETYYSELKAVFRSPGWKHLVDDLEDDYKIMNSVDLIGDNHSLDYHKGYIQALTFVLDRPVRLEEESKGRDEDHS
jgi:hypothetical protein